jgi:hypothetical protein
MIRRYPADPSPVGTCSTQTNGATSGTDFGPAFPRRSPDAVQPIWKSPQGPRPGTARPSTDTTPERRATPLKTCPVCPSRRTAMGHRTSADCPVRHGATASPPARRRQAQRRLGARLFGALRTVGNPGHGRTVRRRAVCLYIASASVNVLSCRSSRVSGWTGAILLMQRWLCGPSACSCSRWHAHQTAFPW